MLQCSDCSAFFHRTCLSLRQHAYPGAVFRCADCLLWEARIPNHPEGIKIAGELVHLLSCRLAESTDKAYHSALNRFRRFVVEVLGLDLAHALPHKAGEAVPNILVQMFLVYSRHEYSISSLEMSLTALNNLHRSKGIEAPIQSREVQSIMHAIKREKGSLAHQPQPKASITPQILMLVLTFLDTLQVSDPRLPHSYLYIRDQVVFCLGYYGLLRRSEIIALKASDVAINKLPDGMKYIQITIRKSKTDQRGQGAHVCLAPITRHHVNLLLIFSKWMAIQTSLNPSPSAAFIPSYNRQQDAFLGHLSNGQALATRLKFYLQLLAEKFPFLGLKPEQFGMHSFRRGGTTDAWECGVDRELLKLHGRWRSEAINRYLQAPILMRLRATGTV